MSGDAIWTALEAAVAQLEREPQPRMFPDAYVLGALCGMSGASPAEIDALVARMRACRAPSDVDVLQHLAALHG